MAPAYYYIRERGERAGYTCDWLVGLMAASPLLYIGRRRWIKKQPTERCPRDRATGTAALIIAIRLNDDNGAIQVHFFVLAAPRWSSASCERRMFLYFYRTHKIPALLGKLLHLTVDLLRKDPNYKKRCSNGRGIVSTRQPFVSEFAAKKWRVAPESSWENLAEPNMVRLQKLRPICQNQAPLITHRCEVNPGELNGRFTRRMTLKMNNISPITTEQDLRAERLLQGQEENSAVGFISCTQQTGVNSLGTI